MIFNYGKMMYNSPLKELDPTKYKLLGYYAGLEDEIVKLKADKDQLETYKEDLQDCVDDCRNIGLSFIVKFVLAKYFYQSFLMITDFLQVKT